MLAGSGYGSSLRGLHVQSELVRLPNEPCCKVCIVLQGEFIGRVAGDFVLTVVPTVKSIGFLRGRCYLHLGSALVGSRTCYRSTDVLRLYVQFDFGVDFLKLHIDI